MPGARGQAASGVASMAHRAGRAQGRRLKGGCGDLAPAPVGQTATVPRAQLPSREARRDGKRRRSVRYGVNASSGEDKKR